MYATCVDCSEAVLGNLSGYSLACDGGGAEIKGVDIPKNVLDQLKRLGFPLFSYSRGQLEEAVQACAFDGNLIDDPDGEDFEDMLELTEDEKETRHSFRDDMERARAKKYSHAAFSDE
jgi:hypothetical protein